MRIYFLHLCTIFLHQAQLQNIKLSYTIIECHIGYWRQLLLVAYYSYWQARDAAVCTGCKAGSRYKVELLV